MLFQAACARVSLAPGGMSRGAGMHAAGSRVRLGEVTRGRCAVPLPGSAGRRLRRQGLGREADPGVWDSSREHPWSCQAGLQNVRGPAPPSFLSWFLSWDRKCLLSFSWGAWERRPRLRGTLPVQRGPEAEPRSPSRMAGVDFREAPSLVFQWRF